ncbi:MAG: cation transporter [Solirubrobacterales bacterium]|nr:cation transporter [Solirubrobacterales bacterium]
MSTAFELPVITAAPPAPAMTRARYEELARKIKLLSWLSLVWMTIEGAVALGAGTAANSIALIGFGLDSVIEGVASVVIIWRFTGSRTFSEAAEQRSQTLVAWQFFLLAPYVAFESLHGLLTGERPDVSRLGIGLAIGSVVLMPLLAIAKQRLAEQVGSPATRGEGRQNMLCAYLAGALLVGLLGNALLGAWWLDPTVGLLIAFVAVREGRDAMRGEGCGCCASPLEALAPPEEDSCAEACCR